MRPAVARPVGLLLLASALALGFLSLWIYAPAPTRMLLPLAVGAPEVSPLLMLASATVCALALLTSRSNRLRAPAAVLAAAAAVASASPLVRLQSTLGRFDDAMMAGLGGDALRSVPPEVVAALRPRAVVPGDFIRGIGRGASRLVRGVEFARPAGVALRLNLYRPLSSGPFPVVVQIYGGAWQRGTPFDNAAFARALASTGYVVCAIDYRHAPAWRWPAQIEDVRAALSWIDAHAAEYGGDATRMALVGRSSGAQLALVAAYEGRAPHVRAVVTYYGPTDLPQGWRHPPSPDPLGTRSILETLLGGTPDDKPETYREASPIDHVEGTSPPTLLVYGTRDHVVEARFGRALHQRLQSAGATSVLLEIPWAEHAFDLIPNGLDGQVSLYYTERFLAWALHRR